MENTVQTKSEIDMVWNLFLILPLRIVFQAWQCSYLNTRCTAGYFILIYIDLIKWSVLVYWCLHTNVQFFISRLCLGRFMLLIFVIVLKVEIWLFYGNNSLGKSETRDTCSVLLCITWTLWATSTWCKIWIVPWSKKVTRLGDVCPP